MKTPPRGWGIASLVGFAVVSALLLSMWQLTKGFEKNAERLGYIEQLYEDPIDVSEYQEHESSYRQMRLAGRYVPERSFVVGYQRHNQIPGYWIITPFQTDLGTFLINRGWIPIQQSFLEVPDIETPEETVEITGVIWPHQHFPSDKSYDASDWPRRVKRLNIKRMAELTESFEDEVRILGGNPGAFTPIQLLVANEPAMHWGYAFQWIVIAALLVSGYWFLVVRKGAVGKN